MFETILACVVLTAGGALLAYATIGRLCGFHRPWKWQGGGQVSWVGELSFSVGILCGGLAALQQSGLWVLPALAAWVVLYFSHRRAYRRYAAEEDELRARNAANYPGVFDDPPPDDMDGVHADELDLFDSGACTYLGRVAKLDLKALIDRFGDMPEQGPNDIFLIPESLGVLPEGSLSQEFVMLLNKAFEQRDFLMLRWMPPNNHLAGAEIAGSMPETVIDAILGCLVGGAIGDAAGAAFEGKPVGPTVLALLDADWRLTDDTQLTLATCEALTDTENPDPASIAASFLRWFRTRRLTGMGSSTLKALRDLDVGVHWALAGHKGERAAGNGAAMRIAPLAFCVDPLLEQSRRLIRDICRITHHNDEAYTGALAVVLAIRAAKESRLSLDGIASCLPETSVRERLASYAALPPNATLAEAAQRYGVSGYVVESVPFALFAASRVQELGFVGMLEQIIAAGGDTDTNASLAGQVAGTALGFGKLPKEFLTRLPQADLVLGIARSFAERLASR